MNKNTLKDFVGWGLVLWVFGYILGIILFFVLPPALLGWFIMPLGVLLTFYILEKKIHSQKLTYYFYLGIVWTVLAIILDYIFIVIILHPADGYYKLDVYLYYLLTFLLPVIVGKYKGAQ